MRDAGDRGRKRAHPLRFLHCCTAKASRAATNSQTGLATKKHEEFLRFGPVPIAPIGARETPSAAPGNFLCLFVATPQGFGCGSAALGSFAAKKRIGISLRAMQATVAAGSAPLPNCPAIATGPARAPALPDHPRQSVKSAVKSGSGSRPARPASLFSYAGHRRASPTLESSEGTQKTPPDCSGGVFY
jgi:hypothetical protein